MVERLKILVTGCNGQLGSSIKGNSDCYNYIFFFKEKSELDISNYNILKNYLKKNKIDTVINCAAFTDVENSEVNKELADKINHCAVDNLAKLCAKFNIQLIHISTDYVFDGNRNIAYSENIITNPINYYGLTKLKGEKKIFKYDLKNSAIIRTSWLYSNSKNNFVSKIISKINTGTSFSVTDKEYGSPTNVEDLSRTILEIIPQLKNTKTQIYHFSNLGICSRYDLAIKIRQLTKGVTKISPEIKSSSMVNRPKFTPLDSTKLSENFKIEIKDWETSLKEHLSQNINSFCK